MASTTAPADEKRVGYLFGTHITHSFSPILHQTVFNHLGLPWQQVLFDSLSVPDFLELTKQPSFFGASVTMPHKVAIIPHLDALTAEATSIGAVNTIFLDPTTHKLTGTNTDCIGIREALARNIPPATYTALKGHPAAIVGGGGTSRAAVYALKHWIGASTIYMLNRDAAEVAAVISECLAAGFITAAELIWVESPAHAASLPKPKVIVSAIPDFEPVTAGEVAVKDELDVFLAGQHGALLEMCYNPTTDTRIARRAGAAGWAVVPGTEAMIWQGVEQDRYWTGKTAEELPVEEMKAVIAGALAARAKDLSY